MLARVFSCAVIGLDGVIVEAEVDTGQGLPGMTIVGMPDAGVQESRERVYNTIKNTVYDYPRKRIVVNLAPATVRKEGPIYDLPIALGVLAMMGIVPLSQLDDAMVIGELSLDGTVRHTRGVLPMAATARSQGFKRLFVPGIDAPEAALVPEMEVFPVHTLDELIGHLSGRRLLTAQIPPDPADLPLILMNDFREVKGQEHVKRALEVAAAGAHNILMVGPPGSGKTLLARTLPGILPRMTFDEALDVTRIYSIADQLPADTPLLQHRPFRSPHHTISHAGLVGGGNWPQPGEISLAHRGVLFLDELPEFNPRALEVLRQPMEDKFVTFARAQGSLTFPANFQLVSAMNPCPCGYYNDPVKECTCSSQTITRYQKRISGPLMDRIDIHIEVPRVDYEKLSSGRLGESSETIQGRVEAARERQRRRFADSDISSNADMRPKQIRTHCALDQTGEALMKSAMQQMQLSARAYHRILKLALTIADLASSEVILPAHLAEALQYRARNVINA